MGIPDRGGIIHLGVYYNSVPQILTKQNLQILAKTNFWVIKIDFKFLSALLGFGTHTKFFHPGCFWMPFGVVYQ